VNSRVYSGELAHARVGTVRHRFRYPVRVYCFDLDELSRLARELPWFGHNRWRPLALWDRDYLDAGPGGIREKLERLLAAHGVTGVARAELVTTARWFGHAFNPVSFHFAYDAGGGLLAAVAEVNNTFGERHTYVLGRLRREGDSWVPEAPVAKAFHVSPFYDRAGEYRFRLALPRQALDLGIELHREGALAFAARLTGRAEALDRGHLARTLARAPFTEWLTWPRILAQAARLHFAKRLPARPLPPPASPLTRRTAPPSWAERAAQALVFRAFSRIRDGALDVRLPDGTERSFGDPLAVKRERLEVSHGRFFARLVRDADVGLGEGWTAGEFRTPDLAGLLERLAVNRDAMNGAVGALAAPGLWLRRAAHAARRNTRAGSRRNIRAHYDLGNDFFERLLDPSMTYSSARWDGREMELAGAQERKLTRAAELAALAPGMRVLEIGCGWGSFAIRAARDRGCRVTGLTLSPAQLEVARERARAAGVADLTEFRLLDYRDVRGTFDAVVSIEMIEAVGHEYLGGYFAAIDRLLAHGGRAVIQAITIADRRYAAYLRNPDWIQKHIFPGGRVPSVGAMVAAMTRASTLRVERHERFGADYARTLSLWRANLLRHADELGRLGYGEEFRRKFEYYLAYCEAGFRADELDVGQFVLARPAASAAALPGA
jgi:cyclopropane-fatty-acyl-phospholipid synthase